MISVNQEKALKEYLVSEYNAQESLLDTVMGVSDFFLIISADEDDYMEVEVNDGIVSIYINDCIQEEPFNINILSDDQEPRDIFFNGSIIDIEL